MAESRKSKLFEKYIARMSTLKKDEYASSLFDSLKNGKNSYMRIDRLKSSDFDLTWIDRIEDCIYDIGDIVANPKQVTKEATSIVPIELARKTGAESVQHLASHTQYIKEVNEKGEVVPNKILNIGSEEDIHTYENKFIATLIRRLVLFIEKRYEYIKKFAPLADEEILYYKTISHIEGAEVEIETKVKVRSDSSSQMDDVSSKYVKRILEIREYIMHFYNSKFMKELKTERNVRNPIVMTNILRKNPKYHKCYELFRFIERYDQLGISYKLDENASIFSDAELDELNTVMLTNYLALKGKDMSLNVKKTSKVYKPKILTSIDDEQFTYGHYIKGPIEFLRVDQGYLDYLDSKNKPDIPVRPTKVEKEYYKDEIAEKKKAQAEKAELDKLAKRKKKEALEYEKQVKAIIAQREKEEAERIARELELARLEEEKRIEEVRRALKEQAKSDKPEVKQELKELAKEEANEELIQDENNIEEPLEEEVLVEEVIQEEQPSEEIINEESPVIEEPQPQIEEESLNEIRKEDSIEEEIQPVYEETRDELVVEKPKEENPISEEKVIEPVTEEVPQVDEIVEQPQEEPQKVDYSDQSIDEIRKQLMGDSLEDLQVEESSESTIEHPVEEETVEVIEEQPQAEETPVEEQPIASEDPSLDEIRKQLMSEAFIDETLQEQPFEETPVEEEKPQEETSINEELPVEEEIIEEPTEEESIVEETPIVEEEPQVEEVVEAPHVKEISIIEQPQVEETPVVEEQPQPKKRRGLFSNLFNRRNKKEEKVGELVKEETPVQEIVMEKPIAEETQIEVEQLQVEETPVEEKPQVEEPQEEVSLMEEEQPVSYAEPVKNEQKPVEEAEISEEIEKIPGKFIVKTHEGYYVKEEELSIYKNDAKIFDDFLEANGVKKRIGGKVVKL